MLNWRNCCLVLCVLVLGRPARPAEPTIPPASQVQEDQLITTLQSDASHQAKAEACRHLQVYGTKKSIPALEALLADEKLSHMARVALEPMPDPAVDEALRRALDRLQGRPLVGVIGSIGVRKDAQAVDALAKRLLDKDIMVAQAAARALGSIGTQQAAAAIEANLDKMPKEQLLHAYEGLLRCAEALSVADQRDAAVRIYDSLRSLPEPHQVVGGAVRGAILARGRGALQTLREALTDKNYIVFSAAVQASQEMRGRRVTSVLCSVLPDLDADRKIVLTETLAMRHDAGALPTLMEQAKAGPVPVRQAAIKGLVAVGSPDAVPGLVALLDDPDESIAQTAQASLAALACPEVDAAVMAMLKDASTARQLTALELIGRRRMVGAMDSLFEAARSSNPQVRATAVRRIGELGGPSDLPRMLGLLDGMTGTDDQRAAEQTLRSLCTPNGQRDSAAVAMLCERIGQAQGPAKHILLRVAGAMGGSEALQAVRAAMKSNDAQVRSEATRALLGWPNAEAAPDMLTLAKDAPNPTERIAALRAYIGAARDPGLGADEKVAMCGRAREMVSRAAEKRLLLGVLGGVASPKALAMVSEYLDDPETKNEAALAAVGIGEKLAEQKAEGLAPVMRKVLHTTDNDDVKKRAQAVLQKVGG